MSGVILRIERKREQVAMVTRAYVRRHLAMLCADCPALYEADGHSCPACGSPHAFPVARWLDRTTTAGEALRGAAKEGA